MTIAAIYARKSTDQNLPDEASGLRLLSEALTLRWADVDLTRDLVTVQAA